jgi:hypothetical protein
MFFKKTYLLFVIAAVLSTVSSIPVNACVADGPYPAELTIP